MFIISITYTANIDQVDKCLEQHITFIDEQYALGDFSASGRKVPRTGGIIFSCVSSRSEIESIMKQDPFYKEQVAEFEITEFIPTKTSPGFSCILEN